MNELTDERPALRSMPTVRRGGSHSREGSLLVGFGYLLLSAPAPAQLAADAYETDTTVLARDLLAPEIYQSGHHRVRDQVTLEGDRYVFEVESDYGIYQIQSIPMLEIRVREIEILAQAISQYKVSDGAFAEELRGQLSVNAYSIVDVVRAPFSMASQLASNITQTAEELSELPRAGTSPVAGDDPYVDAVSADAIRGAHKRNVAYQLGLDAYSSNPRVQQFLNTVANARSSGHFKAGVATIRVPPIRMVEVQGGKLDGQLRDAMKNLTPAELDAGIDAQLKALEVAPDVRRAFLHHPSFSPRHRTAITAHLDFMRGVANRRVLIEASRAARSEPDALSYELLTRMLAYYHETVEPLGELQLIADLPVALTQTGRLLLIMPVDTIGWSPEMDRLFETLSRKMSMDGFEQRELILTGDLGEAAGRGIERYGFGFRTNFLTIE